MNYKFANKVFNIKSLYDSFSIFAKEYITSQKEDYTISINNTDVDEWLVNHPEDKDYPRSYLECLVIHKMIAEVLAKFDTYIIHGSSVSYKGKGYIFLAPSGVGKSTHVSLLKKKLGNELININDDKPFIDKDFNLYGSPWDGKERLSNTIKAPLKGIFILKRGITPSYKKLSPKEAITEVYSQIHIVDDVSSLDYVIRLCSSVPTYVIQVNMEQESIEQTIKLMELMSYEN